jgi:hypothetical protein
VIVHAAVAMSVLFFELGLVVGYAFAWMVDESDLDELEQRRRTCL